MWQTKRREKQRNRNVRDRKKSARDRKSLRTILLCRLLRVTPELRRSSLTKRFRKFLNTSGSRERLTCMS